MDNELMHYGILGMKWGVRRYQNKDGTLTAKGKKRYNAEMERLKAKERKLKNEQRTKAKLAKLDSQRKKVEDLKRAKNKKTDEQVDTKPRKKAMKELSNEELKSLVTRLELEKRYKDLNPEQVSAGKKFLKDTIIPSLTTATKNTLTDYATKKGKSILGLNDSPDPIQDLRKTVEKLNLEKQYKDLTDTSTRALRDDVARLTLEKQLKKLLEERES